MARQGVGTADGVWKPRTEQRKLFEDRWPKESAELIKFRPYSEEGRDYDGKQWAAPRMDG